MAKPDFTGRWKFSPGKSSLQIPSPDSTTFVIEHNEPRFHLERTHVFGGNSDTFSIDLTTDGRVVELNHGGFGIRAGLHWEGETLVFDSILNREGEQATNIVRYKLADKDQSLPGRRAVPQRRAQLRKQVGFRQTVIVGSSSKRVLNVIRADRVGTVVKEADAL